MLFTSFSPSFDVLHSSPIVYMDHMEPIFQDLLLYCTKKVTANHNNFFHFCHGSETNFLVLAPTLIYNLIQNFLGGEGGGQHILCCLKCPHFYGGERIKYNIKGCCCQSWPRPINNKFQRQKKKTFFHTVIIDYFWVIFVKSETFFLLLFPKASFCNQL